MSSHVTNLSEELPALPSRLTPEEREARLLKLYARIRLLSAGLEANEIRSDEVRRDVFAELRADVERANRLLAQVASDDERLRRAMTDEERLESIRERGSSSSACGIRDASEVEFLLEMLDEVHGELAGERAMNGEARLRIATLETLAIGLSFASDIALASPQDPRRLAAMKAWRDYVLACPSVTQEKSK